MNAGTPKSPKNVTSTFFNAVNVLPKDLKFEHGGAKLASCPGRHLISLRPCVSYFNLGLGTFFGGLSPPTLPVTIDGTASAMSSNVLKNAISS